MKHILNCCKLQYSTSIEGGAWDKLTLFNCFLALSPITSTLSRARYNPSAVTRSVFKTGIEAIDRRSRNPIFSFLLGKNSFKPSKFNAPPLLHRTESKEGVYAVTWCNLSSNNKKQQIRSRLLSKRLKRGRPKSNPQVSNLALRRTAHDLICLQWMSSY